MNNMNAMAANMNPMAGGPVGGAPMPIMNNGVVPPQPGPRQVSGMDNRALLNTYIYEYFLRNSMYDCAQALLKSGQPIKISKDSKNGNVNGLGDDPMDTDSKDDLDSKRNDSLPEPNLPVPLNDSCFLYEWFCLFWDLFNAQKGEKASGPQVSQYVAHTQQQSRMKQNQQQEMLRNIRPDQFQMMKNISNAAMMTKNNLARTAMANNQNPNMMMMAAKQGQMQRDPSNMDGNQQRPASPGSSENAPSPSKRPRLEGPTGQFPNQQNMMRNGGPQAPGQPVGTGPGSSMSQTHQMLLSNGINPSQLTQQQLNTFANQAPMVQAKSIQAYAQNLQQHHNTQMPNKQMPNPGGPQGQGSPMIPQGPDALTAYYNGNMAGADGMRGGGPAGAPGGGSNHALQDYQMQLMLLEQQNKKRLMMARQEQNDISNAMPRPDGPQGPGGPGGPSGPNAPPGVAQAGPNGQGFQESPQVPRAGPSPNPTDMKRGTPQMNNASIPSPLPEGAQSRGSPNAMNFMGNQMDPNQAPHFYNGMEGNRVANPQINGSMRPPSSHPGMPGFNGQQMTPQQQQMMAQRQQQQQQQQGQGQAQGQPGAQGGPNMQWQHGGPNGNPGMPQGAQGPQGAAQGPQPVQNTPQQRAMPPPSGLPAGNANTNARNTTASPQQNTQPPTPQQSNKTVTKKKDNKTAKDKKRTAAQKKSASNLNAGATPAAENTQEGEPPTPATPVTPVNANLPNKGNQPAPAPQPVPNGGGVSAPPPPAPTAPVAPQPPQDQSQANFMDGATMDFSLGFADPMQSDNVLQDFDFDSFLHDNEGGDGSFDFNTTTFAMDGNEISAE